MTRAWLVSLLAVVGLTALALSAGFRELTFHVLFGWAVFLARVLPQITVRRDGVVFFLLGLATFTVLLHRIAAWLRHEMCAHAAWRWRSTAIVVGLVMMMFVGGIAMVGITHQIVWLATDDAPLVTPALSDVVSSRHQLMQMGLAVHNFHDTFDRLPTRTPLRPEEAEHSWVTCILPYLSFRCDLDRRQPWDHPNNQSEIQKLVPTLLNPDVRPAVLRDASGYGVSHYAGNTLLFDDLGNLSLFDISDGTANTLMIGEVCADFQPWAKPRANRDPALGVNRSPQGFGSPTARGGVLFVMADGSIKLLAANTDPAILKALSTPNGQEAEGRTK